MLSTMYLIVTVTVNRPSVYVPIVMMVSIEMMDFNQCFGHENESTGITSSILPF